jgi:hypothetical protein
MSRLGGPAIALLRNLLLGVRAALLWPVSLDRVATGWLPIVATLLLAPLPWFVAQRIDVGPDGVFFPMGLPGIWFPFALIVVASTLAAGLLRCEDRIGALLLVLLNANIAIDVVVCALPFLATARTERYIDRLDSDLAGYWLGLVLAVLVVRLRGWRSIRGWLVAIVAGAAIMFAINHVWQTTLLWGADDTDYYKDQPVETPVAALDEDILYLQPGLLQDKLQRLQPGQAGQPNLYFLGVAGDSAQKVFLREIRSVYQIMLGRFTEPGRSLLLINNFETARSEPIATVTSIRAAAQRFAQVMDRDNDILFVYLTSHGSREEGFHLDLPPLRMQPLQPAELRRTLDEAGIRWRVIVVSACYSGIFIEPLADAHTLVITAAAADRTSFGCADENDYTYFGRAYFADALAKTDSFLEAFALARATVTELEKAEGETPSLPQVSIGRDIAAKLATLPLRDPR